MFIAHEMNRILSLLAELSSGACLFSNTLSVVVTKNN
jgi:hypothetical protein